MAVPIIKTNVADPTVDMAHTAGSITNVTNGISNIGLSNGTTDGITNGDHLTVDGGINDAADRVKFAYWVPNVSGGLVISKIPQRTKYHIQNLLGCHPIDSWTAGIMNPM
jgi:hypothetical protein